jgi:beta-carotene hydroxylase
MAGVLVGFALLVGALVTGPLSPWLAIPALALCYYAVSTVLHESMHGLAHRDRRINLALGRVAGFALLLPLPLFRAAHLAHHSHTNDPSRDPDFLVARRPVWLRPVWFLLTPVDYRVKVYGSGLLRARSSRIEAWSTEAAILGTIVGCVALGHGLLLAQLWLLPATLAILWLALAFDLLPHHPHTTRERYFDTRIYPGRLLNWLLLGQNYHLIHHLWTTIPWYRYQRAFHEVEADLAALGAPIGWSSRAERPAALETAIDPLLVPTQSAPLSHEAGGLSSAP